MCAITPAAPLSEKFVTLPPHFESAPEHAPWTFASPDPHSSPRLQAKAVKRTLARILIRPQRGQGITCHVRHGLEDWRSGRQHGREGGRPLDRDRVQGSPREALHDHDGRKGKGLGDRDGLHGCREGQGEAFHRGAFHPLARDRNHHRGAPGEAGAQARG